MVNNKMICGVLLAVAIQACTRHSTAHDTRSVSSAHVTAAVPASAALTGAVNGPTATVATSTGAFTRLVSPNGAFNLVMQTDGNLVEYNYLKAVWSSQTSGAGPYNAILQPDGNLVIYQQNGQIGDAAHALWSSGTSGRGAKPYQLTVQNDGNVVLFDATGSAMWSTNVTDQSGDQPWVNFEAAVSSSGSFSSLSSPNLRYTFLMQSDCNLVEYQGNAAIWSSQTSGQGAAPCSATMQNDGNLVIYDANGAPLWASGSSGKGVAPYSLSVTNYGNVKIYDSNQILIWSAIGSSGTLATGSTWTPPPAVNITNQVAGRCLNSTNISNGEQATLWDCSQTDYNGVWSYSLNNEIQVGADLSRCLTYEYPGNVQAYVDTQPCTGASNQAWSISAADGSYGAIKPMQDASQCLDIYNWGTDNGTPLIVYPCTGGADQNWAKNSTGLGIYNGNLPNWPDPSYTDTNTKSAGQAAWNQVASNLTSAAAAGATSFTIPPGRYFAATPIAVNNVPQNFTIYAAGVEVIEESYDGVLVFNNDGVITVNGPMIIDADATFTNFAPAIITAVNNPNWIQVQVFPGYPALESTRGQGWGFEGQFFDRLGTNLPKEGEYASGAVGSEGGIIALNGGSYQVPWLGNDLASLSLEVGMYTTFNIGEDQNPVIYQNNSDTMNLNHITIYGAMCCQTYAPQHATFRDFKLAVRPGTNRLTGPYSLFNWSNNPGSTFTMDETEISYATDDLIDVKVNPGQSLMLSGTVIDSYFHDGDNDGIQIKGAETVNVTNNYTARIIRCGIFLTEDGESNSNTYVNIANNTVSQSNYATPDWYGFPSIAAQSPNTAILNAMNNKAINAPIGFAFQAQTVNDVNNQFTANADGALVGWQQ